jgi:hypothetical protein
MNDETSQRSDIDVGGPKGQLLRCDCSVHVSRSGIGPLFPVHHGSARQTITYRQDYSFSCRGGSHESR